MKQFDLEEANIISYEEYAQQLTEVKEYAKENTRKFDPVKCCD